MFVTVTSNADTSYINNCVIRKGNYDLSFLPNSYHRASQNLATSNLYINNSCRLVSYSICLILINADVTATQLVSHASDFADL